MERTSLVARAIAMEAGGCQSLARWIGRRPRTAPGATGFSYTAPSIALFHTFIGVSAVETIGVDLLLHRWPYVRLPVLALGIWGVIFMVGMLASHKVNPHEVGPAGVTVRHGTGFAEVLGWADFESVRAVRTGYDSSKAFQVAESVLSVVVMSETTVMLALRRPLLIRGEKVVGIRLHADDPQAFVRAAKGYV